MDICQKFQCTGTVGKRTIETKNYGIFEQKTQYSRSHSNDNEVPILPSPSHNIRKLLNLHTAANQHTILAQND